MKFPATGTEKLQDVINLLTLNKQASGKHIFFY